MLKRVFTTIFSFVFLLFASSTAQAGKGAKVGLWRPGRGVWRPGIEAKDVPIELFFEEYLLPGDADDKRFGEEAIHAKIRFNGEDANYKRVYIVLVMRAVKRLVEKYGRFMYVQHRNDVLLFHDVVRIFAENYLLKLFGGIRERFVFLVDFYHMWPKDIFQETCNHQLEDKGTLGDLVAIVDCS